MRKKYMHGVFDCPYPTQSLLTSFVEWWAGQDYTFLLVQLTRKNILKQFNLGHPLDFEIPKIYVGVLNIARIANAVQVTISL